MQAELEARKARRRKQGTGRQFPPGPAELTAQIMKARCVRTALPVASASSAWLQKVNSAGQVALCRL